MGSSFPLYSIPTIDIANRSPPSFFISSFCLVTIQCGSVDVKAKRPPLSGKLLKPQLAEDLEMWGE